VLLLLYIRMLPSTRAAVTSSSRRCLSTDQFYKPTLTERREGEGGRGGRASEAGTKVALFGASGFLGNYVCGELGTCEEIEIRSYAFSGSYYRKR
jgi:hypothetical protein